MKIEIKLKADQVNYLASVFESFGNVTVQTFVNQERSRKVIISICMELSDKFSDKFKAISRKSTLFDAKKKYKISLKYYEAHAISVYLRGVELNETDTYRKMTAIHLLTQLDQHLT